jgi:hypothetical protein
VKAKASPAADPPERRPVVAATRTPATGEDDGAVGLLLFGVVPAVLVLLALVPERAVEVGPVGRLVVHARLGFLAVAAAIWLGVLVSMVVGGEA